MKKTERRGAADFMIKASIVSIGNEILSGQTIDTNAAYLSRELLSVGIPVVSFYTVADDLDSIVRSLKLAGEDAQVILATGGLGPTDDDLTRQAFAELLGTDLQLEKELLQRIEDYFANRNLQMSPKNKIQAYIPAGAKALVNNLGTASGIIAKSKGKLFVVVPGVPVEMKQMFEESVLSKLKKMGGKQAVIVRKLRCFGTGESNIAEALGQLCQRGRNPQIDFTAKGGVITLYIVATAENEDRAHEMAEKDEQLLRSKLGDLIYGTAEQTLAQVVGEKLTQQGKTIAVAESCTGGTLAKLLTDVPGATKYFTQGWVTYSNTAKISQLGISADLISKHGAVSQEVAEAMALSAKKEAKTDFAIGITGIAGPAGGSKQKPVGLVYICVCSDNKCETERVVFSHGREVIRLRAAQTALNMLRLKL